MNDLRWILIVAGAILLIGIYLWGRRGNKQDEGVGTIVRSRPDPSAQPHLHERASPESGGDPNQAAAPATGIVVVQNWSEELKQKVPR